MRQAKRRCCRQGQTRDVYVHHVVTAYTLDVDVLEHRLRRGIYGRGGSDVAVLGAMTGTGARRDDDEMGKMMTDVASVRSLFDSRETKKLVSLGEFEEIVGGGGGVMDDEEENGW